MNKVFQKIFVPLFWRRLFCTISLQFCTISLQLTFKNLLSERAENLA